MQLPVVRCASCKRVATALLLLIAACATSGCLANPYRVARSEIKRTVIFRHGQVFFDTSKAGSPASATEARMSIKPISPKSRGKIENYLNYLAHQILDTERRHKFHGFQPIPNPGKFKINITTQRQAIGPQVLCSERQVNIPESFLRDVYLDAIQYSLEDDDTNLGTGDISDPHTFLQSLYSIDTPAARFSIAQRARATRQYLGMFMALFRSTAETAETADGAVLDLFIDASLRQSAMVEIQASSEREYFKGLIFTLAHELSHLWFHCTDVGLSSPQNEAFADKFGVIAAFEQFLSRCSWKTPAFDFDYSYLFPEAEIKALLSEYSPGPASVSINYNQLEANLAVKRSELLAIFEQKLHSELAKYLADEFEKDPGEFKFYAQSYISDCLEAGKPIDFLHLASLHQREEKERFGSITPDVEIIEEFLNEVAEDKWAERTDLEKDLVQFRESFKSYEDLRDKLEDATATESKEAEEEGGGLFGTRNSVFGRDGIQLALGVYEGTNIAHGDTAHLPIAVRMSAMSPLSEFLSDRLLNTFSSEVEVALEKKWFGLFRESKLVMTTFKLDFPTGCPEWKGELQDEQEEQYQW